MKINWDLIPKVLATTTSPGFMSASDKNTIELLRGGCFKGKSSFTGTSISFTCTTQGGARNVYWYGGISNGGTGYVTGVFFIEGTTLVKKQDLVGSSTMSFDNGVVTFTFPRNYSYMIILSTDKDVT